MDRISTNISDLLTDSSESLSEEVLEEEEEGEISESGDVESNGETEETSSEIEELEKKKESDSEAEIENISEIIQQNEGEESGKIDEPLLGVDENSELTEETNEEGKEKDIHQAIVKSGKDSTCRLMMIFLCFQCITFVTCSFILSSSIGLCGCCCSRRTMNKRARGLGYVSFAFACYSSLLQFFQLLVPFCVFLCWPFIPLLFILCLPCFALLYIICLPISLVLTLIIFIVFVAIAIICFPVTFAVGIIAGHIVFLLVVVGFLPGGFPIMVMCIYGLGLDTLCC